MFLRWKVLWLNVRVAIKKLFVVHRYAGVYDELLSPPRRSVEPPYGARYDCKSLNSVCHTRHLPPTKTAPPHVRLARLSCGSHLRPRIRCLFRHAVSGVYGHALLSIVRLLYVVHISLVRRVSSVHGSRCNTVSVAGWKAMYSMVGATMRFCLRVATVAK